MILIIRFTYVYSLSPLPMDASFIGQWCAKEGASRLGISQLELSKIFVYTDTQKQCNY